MPEIEYRAQMPVIGITESASLWDQVDYEKAVCSIEPLTMEELGQDYGYVLYRTEIIGCGAPMELSVPELRDRADVYLDRQYIGTLMRDRPMTVTIDLPYSKKAALELLVENMGRINFGPKLTEQKGIVGSVLVNSVVHLYNWKNLPLDISFQTDGFAPSEGPVVLRGAFQAIPGEDTFLDIRNMKKGYICVNGFNLGRYWNVGPQYTLYVPGELLKETNVIEIFEQYGAAVPFTLPTRTESILE